MLQPWLSTFRRFGTFVAPAAGSTTTKGRLSEFRQLSSSSGTPSPSVSPDVKLAVNEKSRPPGPPAFLTTNVRVFAPATKKLALVVEKGLGVWKFDAGANPVVEFGS